MNTDNKARLIEFLRGQNMIGDSPETIADNAEAAGLLAGSVGVSYYGREEFEKFARLNGEDLETHSISPGEYTSRSTARAFEVWCDAWRTCLIAYPVPHVGGAMATGLTEADFQRFTEAVGYFESTVGDVDPSSGGALKGLREMFWTLRSLDMYHLLTRSPEPKGRWISEDTELPPMPWSVKVDSHPMADSGDYFTSMRVLDANGKNVELYDGEDQSAEDTLRFIVETMNALHTAPRAKEE